jgi:hypothetical protein
MDATPIRDTPVSLVPIVGPSHGITCVSVRSPVSDAQTEELTEMADTLPCTSAVNVTLGVLMKFGGVGTAAPFTFNVPLSSMTKLFAIVDGMSSVDNSKFGVSLDG